MALELRQTPELLVCLIGPLSMKQLRERWFNFGTPGLLSLQFVVASIAAVASSFVFLSLVLNQRKKELAVLQAIGASPTQILRLVLFEILSIIIVSMYWD